MPGDDKKSIGFLVLDKLIIALIVLGCTVAGNIYADTKKSEHEIKVRQRELVVEKTSEVWKSLMLYRTNLDRISALKSEKHLTTLFKAKPIPDWDGRMKKALDEKSKAREALDKTISESSFYIGPELTQKATLYAEFITGYYEQSDEIKNSTEKPGEFSLKMLEDTQALLEETSRYLSMDGSYKFRESTEQ